MYIRLTPAISVEIEQLRIHFSSRQLRLSLSQAHTRIVHHLLYMMHTDVYTSSMYESLSIVWRESRNERKAMPDNFLSTAFQSPILVTFTRPNTSEESQPQLQPSRYNFIHCLSYACVKFLICCQVSMVSLKQPP